MGVVNTPGQHLKTWVPEALKKEFYARAVSEGSTSSRLLRKLIEEYLQTSPPPGRRESDPQPPGHRMTRLTIRLWADDRRQLKQAAQTKALPSSTYVSILVRAHLRQVAPLVGNDLRELRRATAALDVVGRNLSVLARQALTARDRVQVPKAELAAVIEACVRLRDKTRHVLDESAARWRDISA